MFCFEISIIDWIRSQLNSSLTSLKSNCYRLFLTKNSLVFDLTKPNKRYFKKKRLRVIIIVVSRVYTICFPGMRRSYMINRPIIKIKNKNGYNSHTADTHTHTHTQRKLISKREGFRLLYNTGEFSLSLSLCLGQTHTQRERE